MEPRRSRSRQPKSSVKVHGNGRRYYWFAFNALQSFCCQYLVYHTLTSQRVHQNVQAPVERIILGKNFLWLGSSYVNKILKIFNLRDEIVFVYRIAPIYRPGVHFDIYSLFFSPEKPADLKLLVTWRYLAYGTPSRIGMFWVIKSKDLMTVGGPLFMRPFTLPLNSQHSLLSTTGKRVEFWFILWAALSLHWTGEKNGA